MDVFELQSKISLNATAFNQGIKSAEKTGSNFADKLGKKLQNLERIAKAVVAGKAVTTLVSSFVKPAVAAYAQFEQLVGGVETLFKDAAVFVQQDAAKAFQTAGMSANQYMETATSFAASLIQGLKGDTLAAAEYANRAIIDMSDNANKMGTDMEAIQNAYRGFSKQNYTMLDNLKLGYGGTRTEMERLLADAEKLTGKKFDISNYADIVDAIHAIQVQMGIAGTTAKEAATTIEGSAKATKAAWQNLLVAMADPKGNVKKATANLVNSAKTMLKNVLPIIKQTLTGIGDFVTEVAPMIGEYVPELLTDFVPKFFAAGKDLAVGIGKGILSGIKKIKWPTWKDVKLSASNAWKKVKDGVEELGGLVFGKNEDGTVHWPTWSDIVSAADSLWNDTKEYVADLGGLVFGRDTEGKVNWPSWEQIIAFAGEKWNYVIGEIKKLPPLIFGENSVISGALQNVFSFLQDFGGWVITNADGVAQGLATILGVITLKKFVGLAAVNPLLAGIAAGALLVVTNWDAVKTKVQELNDSLFDFKHRFVDPIAEQILDPINELGTKLLGGGNRKLLDWQITTLMSDYDRVKRAERSWGKAQGENVFKEFATNFKTQLKGAGFSAEEIEKFLTGIDMSMSVEEMQQYIDSINSADEQAQTLKEDVEGVAGDYNIRYHISTDGGVVDPWSGGQLFDTTIEAEKTTERSGHSGSFAKGAWNIPYDNYEALLHRGEMVLTASQARSYREGRGEQGGSVAPVVDAVNALKTVLSNLSIQVGGKEFGRATVRYGGGMMNGYLGTSNRARMIGYGTR